jgi:hypothetical protein
MDYMANRPGGSRSMRNASVSDTLCDLDHHDLLDFWP